MSLPPNAALYHARTDQGVDLPIIDVTHPAFALSVSADEEQRLLERFVVEQRQMERLPRWLNGVLLRWYLRRSVLAGSLRAARGSYLSGLDTYLFKLGPDHLPAHCRSPVDLRIAASLPALGMRLRLQNTARLLAEAVLPALLADGGRQGSARRPLELCNIAGGPAIDSLNALILLRREHPEAVDRRTIRILVLDRDQAGPSFGQRALAALQGPGAPLAGLSVELAWNDYDWARPQMLDSVLSAARASNAVVAMSSEGGLFEYGTDDAIVSNLETMRRGCSDATVIGSVTRGDAATRQMVQSSRAAIVPRGLSVFETLAVRAGFQVERAVEGPFSDQVLLRPLPRDPGPAL